MQNLKIKVGPRPMRPRFRHPRSKRFCHLATVKMFFAKRSLPTTKWKNTKISCKTTGGVPSQIDHFQELKLCFAFLVNQGRI